jgi:hypothetical protein
MDSTKQARINTLKALKKQIDDMVIDITAGRKTLSSIPFTKADVAKFLPAMTNMNTPLPDLIKSTGGGSFLNSLFPYYSAGDISGAKIAKGVFDNYADDFFKNLSWDISIKHKGEGEREIARNYANAAADARKLADDLDQNGGNTHGPAPVGAFPGFMQTITKNMSASMHSDSTTNKNNLAPASVMHSNEGRESLSGFNWKQRSIQICAQISARGMDPNDFGCLAKPESMRQESFSWRGHARMVCNRLNTIYDTSVPFLCGCPPPTWPGWKA